jgi:hypothetical protein
MFYGMDSGQFNALSHQQVDDFFTPERLMHIYGKIRDYPKEDVFKSSVDWERLFPTTNISVVDEHWDNTILVLDEAYKASSNLKIIDPLTKEDNSSIINAAAEAINRASVIYVLGYGFDKNNNVRIGIDHSLRANDKSRKKVLFTNFGNSDRINKAASRLFLGVPNMFSFGQPSVIERFGGRFYYERSVRDVYGAFELDFDSMEDL